MDSLSINRFHVEDMPGILALNRLHYGDNDLSFLDHATWKYSQGPDGPAHIALCKDMAKDGLIVGKAHSLPRQARVGEQEVLIGVLTDLLVHPGYRGRGIIGRLGELLSAECKVAGLAFSYGMGNPSGRYAFARKLDMLVVGRIPLLIRLFDLRGLRERLSGIPLANIFLALSQAVYSSGGWANRRGHGQARAFTLTVREIEHFDEAFDDFWSRVENKRTVMIKRTARYLEWRFGAVPRRVYRKWVAEENRQVRGYVVTRTMEVRQVPCGMIADFVVEDSAAGWQAGNLLTSMIMDLFCAERVALSGCLMLPGLAEFRLLRRWGYFVCPPRLEPQPFVSALYPHQASIQGPASDINDWFFTMGDYDVV